jgi:pyruvate/2-oxoglutarate dehydrogenase complex dihydrolipoamide acyltransferase (E2) component
MDVTLDELPGDYESMIVLYWHVEEGDFIEEGKQLVKLGFEGKSFPFTSPVTGIVNEIHFSEGEEVRMGDVIASIDEEVEKGEDDEDEDEESI